MEHWHTVESRTVPKGRDPIAGAVTVIQYRYVCSCGKATTWSQDRAKVQRLSKRHALDGQLSHQA